MKLGRIARALGKSIIGLAAAGMFAAAPVALAQAPAEAPAAAAPAAPAVTAAPAPIASIAPAPAAAAANDAAATAAPAAGSYVPMAPTPGKGMPVDGRFGLQDQFSPLGEYGAWMHDGLLMWTITIISIFVLALILYAMFRFRRSRNPTPDKVTHNALIEVIWTLVPVLILVAIAVPSIDLLAKQYKPAPAGALTVKVTGYQWFWNYSFPDNGGFEVASYMLNQPGQPRVNPDVRDVGSSPADGPAQLEVDNRLVLPVGEPIRLQITAADVIHSFGIPSLWFKLDAVPGRINEKVLFIKEPGVYYGQCSELCGVKHGYMPIAIEALPRPQFEAWVLSKGGTVGKPAPAPTGASAAAPAATTPVAAEPAPAAASEPAAEPAKTAA